MRSHTLVAVFAAAGTIADTNIQAPRQRRQTAASIVEWASPALPAPSSSSLHTFSTGRVNLQTARRSHSRKVSRRADDDDDDDDDDEDDDEDEDTDNDTDDDTDDEDDDDDNKHSHQSHTGASK